MRKLLVALGIPVVVYLLALCVLFVTQRSMVFSAATDRLVPQLPGVDEVVLTSDSGLQTYSWYGAAQAEQPTVLYLHGNGGSVGTRETIQQKFLQQGYGVMFVGYPGYGGGQGDASEAALLNAARQNYTYLLQKGLDANDVVIVGESLGTSVAIQLAAEVPSKAVVLLASMLSILEIAEGQFPIVPMKLLLKDPFRSDLHIGDVEVPMLFLHGTADRLIPIDSGRRLFELADTPKEFVAIEAARHNNLFEYKVVERMTSFLRHQAN